MASDAITIARPYAEAVFARAEETGRLDQWSEVLEFLGAVVRDPAARDLVSNPAVDQQKKVDFLLALAGDRLDEEGGNLVRLLVENGRLALLPEISHLYHEMKNAREGVLDVEVVSAYPMDEGLEKELGGILQEKLGRQVHIISREDPELIGGVKIRAGDLVMDGTVAGQLARLANELGI